MMESAFTKRHPYQTNIFLGPGISPGPKNTFLIINRFLKKEESVNNY